MTDRSGYCLLTIPEDLSKRLDSAMKKRSYVKRQTLIMEALRDYLEKNGF